MDKFVIRTKRPRSPCSVNKNSGEKSGAKTDSGSNASVPIPNTHIEERASIEFNSEELISDPGLRIPITEYNVNIRDQVRRELLLCIGSLDPRNSFSSFDKSKLVRLAQFYPEDFSLLDLELLPNQLDNFIYDVRTDKDLSGLQNIGDLSVMMVKTHRHTAYPLVYLLVELALVLPVATATVERVFSAMKTIKTYQRNRMGDAWLNDSMMIYIEKAIFATVDNEAILQHYQNMQNRRIQLSSITSSEKNSTTIGN